jgi:hypothetical protein
MGSVILPSAMDLAADYRHAWMLPVDPEKIPRTEPDVVSPPALWIKDANGDVFTLGFDDSNGFRTGECEFDVVVNARKTGEFACRIERRNGRIKIFGAAGWRVWSPRLRAFV